LSAVRDLTWLPASVCREICQETEGVLSAWAQAWELPEACAVECVAVASGAPNSRDFVDLLDELPNSWRQALAHELFKFDAKGSALVDAVIQRVIDPLQRELRDAFVAVASAREDPVPLGDLGVRVTVELLGQRCGFELMCAQLRAAGKLKATAPAALQGVNFERAFAATPVPLVVELGHAGVSFEELMQLAPGDVLLLNEALDTPLRVLSPNSAFVLRAHLGAASNLPQRAVRCLAS